MGALAGAIEEVTIDGRRFSVTADNDTERDLGGMSADILMNSDGTTRNQQKREAWKLSGIAVEISDIRADQEFLQEQLEKDDSYPITVTFVSGITYAGNGRIIGRAIYKSASATADIELSGGGSLEQQ